MKTIWINQWGNTAVTNTSEYIGKLLNKPGNAVFNFWYPTNMVNVKLILSIFFFQNAALNHDRKWFNSFCLVKQDMLKVWCKFDQILSVFIGDILIWNFEIICFSNDIYENYLNQSMGEYSSNQYFRIYWKAIEQARERSF